MRPLRRALHRVAWCLLCMLAWAAPGLAGTLRVEVMDVGQGDAILITSPAGKRVLIDASIKGADVVGELRERGVQALDLVVATHPHADHIGGMKDVVEALPIRVYTDNGLPHTTQTYTDLMAAIEAREVPYRPAKVGQTFRLDDGILIEVLNPSGTPLSGTRSDLNSNSVVLRLTHGARCFLFTGDAEEPTEQALLRGGLSSCDVLKVAHHGSDHSTTTSLLRTVQPQIALISCGVGNRYGHPGPETMDRLEGQGVRLYRTDTMGDLVVESDGEELVVTTSGKADEPEGEAAVAEAAPAPRRPAAPAGLVPVPAEQVRRAALGTPAAPAEGPQPGEEGCAFVSSRSSALYHPAGCHVVERIWVGNRVCWASEAAAQAAGKTRSQSCPDPAP